MNSWEGISVWAQSCSTLRRAVGNGKISLFVYSPPQHSSRVLFSSLSTRQERVLLTLGNSACNFNAATLPPQPVFSSIYTLSSAISSIPMGLSIIFTLITLTCRPLAQNAPQSSKFIFFNYLFDTSTSMVYRHFKHNMSKWNSWWNLSPYI